MKMKHFGLGFAFCALLLAQAGLAVAQTPPAADSSTQYSSPSGMQGLVAGSGLSAEELAQLRAQADQLQQRLQPLQDRLYAANLRLEVLRSAPDATAAQLNALVDEIVAVQGQIRQIVNEFEAQMGDNQPMRMQFQMFDRNMMPGMGMGYGMMHGGMGHGMGHNMGHNMGMMHGMDCGCGQCLGGVQQFQMNQPGQMPNQMPGQMPGQMRHGGMHHRYAR